MSKKLNLIEHISSKQTKQRYVTQMFETIAPRYDFITVLLSYGMDSGWKRKLIEMLNLRGDERALDLACGTGDITFALGQRLPAGEAAASLSAAHRPHFSPAEWLRSGTTAGQACAPRRSPSVTAQNAHISGSERCQIAKILLRGEMF